MDIKQCLDLGAEYLQKYCVIEVIVILIFSFLTCAEMFWYFENLNAIKEWDVAVLAMFNASSVGVIKYCLDSINIDYKR